MKLLITLGIVAIVVILVMVWMQKSSTGSYTSSTESTYQFLVGTWTGGSTDGEENGLGSSKTLVFTSATMVLDGYPAVHQEGNYQVLSETETDITIRLSDQTGDLPTDDRDVVIGIVDHDTIRFENEVYSRRSE